MNDEHYDVLIIGGGIHGAGVAQAAAAAGYRVLLLEQGELAGGTSSRSSKLIHGGLRYLEHGDFALVRECLRERALLLKNAPGLVRLRRFFIPVYGESSRSPWLIGAGLGLYSLLGGGGFRRLPRIQWAGLDGLQQAGLHTVFQYLDAQTDDAALTRAVMASAQSLGAQLHTQARFLTARRSDERWRIDYRQGEQQRQCAATVLVNAAGPWVNTVLRDIESRVAPLPVDLVQGAHLVLDGRLEKGIYYLESPRDRRPVFAMPWHDRGKDAILLGTTETRFSGDPASVQPLTQEQDYLLDTYRYYFAATPRVCTAFAGLRVLPREGMGNGAYGARARETVLQVDDPHAPRLLNIYGGKLTAYRATADKVLKRLRPSLPARRPVADTRRLRLSPEN
ncbi:MAG TPA: FAD-dependent oxidoreductase [Gammaproteobacteria bacterium]|nr:FAD-dependent oxidoreductase [Gammaproteobacteria bacterium]